MMPACIPSVFNELGESVPFVEGSEDCAAEMHFFLQKQLRCDFFNTQNHFCSLIIKLSNVLVSLEKEHRSACLQRTFEMVNRWIFERLCYVALKGAGSTGDASIGLRGIHLPIMNNMDTRPQLLKVHISECKIFSSRTRAPFLLVFETADLEDFEGCTHDTTPSTTNGAAGERSSGSEKYHHSNSFANNAIMDNLHSCLLEELRRNTASNSTSEEGTTSNFQTLAEALKNATPEAWLRGTAVSKEPAKISRPRPPGTCKRCRRSSPGMHADGKDVEIGGNSGGSSSSSPGPTGAPDSSAESSEEAQQCPFCLREAKAMESRFSIWGETWKRQTERLRSQSSYGHLRSWKLHGAIVKGGDDVRQEMLASQLIGQFAHIFKEAKLPLWLKPIDVLVTSSDSGLIAYVPDSISVDTLKKRHASTTLAEIFVTAFADNLFEAKQNFIESCAAYSLVCYFLQVKDRHNGNLLLDAEGHLIHIDFGFMLSNSPGGNMGFEASPFKLTQEFLDVMDGECSDQYEYFRTLIIRGFLESRKHAERIMLLVRMMLTGSKLPCFVGGADWILQTMHERFLPSLTEEACIEKIADLIDSSVNNWRTIQYDKFQKYQNGIL
eukprot:gnl/MRDRNA2_/MRDRNA2_61675_c0_seq1.p1 gnl/MRDRNA2_/MRDRNA2_61675_c0~~gnl/MRDRNA2_/MRDRNA2_61675_c0_seq1.p1  ORF type:complete len:645 (+),score=103.44 gnl/MRDRNA2_/MRDRNA2_61675_c0_seq1:112-1935(+)